MAAEHSLASPDKELPKTMEAERKGQRQCAAPVEAFLGSGTPSGPASLSLAENCCLPSACLSAAAITFKATGAHVQQYSGPLFLLLSNHTRCHSQLLLLLWNANVTGDSTEWGGFLIHHNMFDWPSQCTSSQLFTHTRQQTLKLIKICNTA